jgi:NADPH:quinone reductase-like Zn-dependent oxidoreductase
LTRQQRRGLPAPPELSDGVGAMPASTFVAKAKPPGTQENMRALVLKRYGKSDQVAFADTPQPVPKPDEILVQVHAAGLNPIDNVIPKGTFKPILRLKLPATLGSDLAGVVSEIGSRVTRFKPGDAVFASIFDLTGTGALAEFALVPENAAALKPANLDFVQAASIPMVGSSSPRRSG